MICCPFLDDFLGLSLIYIGVQLTEPSFDTGESMEVISFALQKLFVYAFEDQYSESDKYTI